MNSMNTASTTDLPSMSSLIKSTILAIAIAAIILVTIVLPAEYGLDPTGVGKMLGLAKMGEIKLSLAQEAASDRLADRLEPARPDNALQVVSEPNVDETSSKTAEGITCDTMVIMLEPNEGKEIKLKMSSGAQVNYLWYTDGGLANFDAHADSKELQISYHGYEKGSLQRNEGSLIAAFDGNHGWFWRNRTSKAMKVTLNVCGDYLNMEEIE